MNDSNGQGMIPHKNMYEGGNGIAAVTSPGSMAIRTHDESGDAPASFTKEPQRQVVASAPLSVPVTAPAADAGNSLVAASSAVNDGLAKASQAEAQKDYNAAITILRQISVNNLQNPEVHHRLAVNLMASGQITEAISEFRIASALCPTKKEYSDDLARALAIHKRSVMSDADTQHSADGVTGASR